MDDYDKNGYFQVNAFHYMASEMWAILVHVSRP